MVWLAEVLPNVWFLFAFGEMGWALTAHFKGDSLLQALCKTRALSKSRLARPLLDRCRLVMEGASRANPICAIFVQKEEKRA